MIPKIIWQTHESKYNDLLPFQKNITNTWKNLNPGWGYRYVDGIERSNQVKEYSEFLHKYYLESDKLHQSDIWRLVAIYNNGGFYADMDSICVETIQDSIERKYKGEEIVCSPIGFQHYGINSSNFGAVKGSKIIKSIIDSLFLQYKEIKLEEVKNLGFGFPENYTFSEICEENKNLVSFNKDYFSHASEYKTSFNSNVEVVFNKEKVNYQTLCTNMNWPIYYI
jgi:hypothetical protein